MICYVKHTCYSQTVFAKGGGHSLDIQAKMGYETIGLDWTVDPVEARTVIGDNITLQGNLDPQDLYKSPVSLASNEFLVESVEIIANVTQKKKTS